MWCSKKIIFSVHTAEKSSQGSSWIIPPQQLGLFITLDQHLMAMWSWEHSNWLQPAGNGHSCHHLESLWWWTSLLCVGDDWVVLIRTFRDKVTRVIFCCSFFKQLMLFPSLLLKIITNSFKFWVFQKVWHHQKEDLFTSCQLLWGFFLKTLLLPRVLF